MMRYTTLLTYKGCEPYVRKSDGGDSALYVFENEYGESEKVTLKDKPDLEIDKQYKVTVRKDRKYYNKYGRSIDEVSYESVVLID